MRGVGGAQRHSGHFYYDGNHGHCFFQTFRKRFATFIQHLTFNDKKSIKVAYLLKLILKKSRVRETCKRECFCPTMLKVKKGTISI